ncbi:MAG: PAS domain-containing sensor histidine kinase [Candidatus Bathyarchaeota archaeon]|nr:MAG: PAS domain-containing sensor histidine kinase [Candidatus Bathyarchaeota archaeon]
MVKSNVEAPRARESQEKFERLFMGNPEASVHMDSSFHVLDVNPRFEELFGYSLDEIKGKHINDVVAPKDKMEEAETLDKKAKKGYFYHNTVRKRKDGSLVPVSISGAPVVVEGRRLEHVAVYNDISQLKRTEKELEESKRHFQALFNALVDPVVIVDGKGRFLEVTDRVEEITGFKKEELLGKNFLRTKIVTAKSKAILIKNLAKRMIGMHMAPYEVEVLTRDGRRLPYEINARKIEYKGKSADLVAFRDVSERKRTTEKLKVLNEKLGVVSKLTRHDVRNKLSAITNNVYLVKQMLAGNHKALKYLGDIESVVQQVESISDFARTYEKLGIEELTSMDVEKTLREVVVQFLNLKDIKVVNDCKGLTVLADSLLRQLFHNLVDNSLKHGEEVSQIRVHYERTEKGQTRLIYEDDGVGIPDMEKEKIFDEGYGKITGYGLSLVRKICEVYGWAIRETGEHGKGAQFTVTIPRKDEAQKMTNELH